MKLRVARHTTSLSPIINFYVNILGLEVLGKFQSHDNYDGVFIGKKELDWHLEFTISPEQPVHTPDDDDLLVFYVDTDEELNRLKKSFEDHGHAALTAKNPYWNLRGLTYSDPDGFKIMISVPKK